MLSNNQINKYINGYCNIFALALKELNNKFQICVNYVLIECEGKEIEVISHAWCKYNNIYIDARGNSLDLFNKEVEESNRLFLKDFFIGQKNRRIEDEKRLLEWIKTFRKCDLKEIKKDIEIAKNEIIDSGFLNDLKFL